VSWALDPESLAVVVEAAARLSPAVAVEYGSGRSTPVLAGHVGHLISLEGDKRWWQVTSMRLTRAGVENVELRLCRLRLGTYDTDLPDGVGFALIDGPRIREGRSRTLPQLWPHLTGDAVVFVDDLHHRRVAGWVRGWERSLRCRVVPVSERLAMVTR